MSRLVKEWLIRLGLFLQTTHEDRVQIDREIERRTGLYCDEAVRRGLITEREFKEIVATILSRKRRKKEVVSMVV